MIERKDVITFQGNPLTLLGEDVKVGEPAPDFVLLDRQLNPIKFSELPKKTYILSVVPSLDTQVCNMQTLRFDEEAAEFDDDDVEIITISMDLPFAQNRWAEDSMVEHITFLSDHKAGDFGAAYGLLIKELRLLARAVMVVDKTGKVIYKQIVDEVASEPAYEAALKAAKDAS